MLIQPDYIEIESLPPRFPARNFPRGYLAGPGDSLKTTDPLADTVAQALNQLITGGTDPNAPGRQDRVAFYSDVLNLTGQKFVASAKGKETIDNLTGSVQKSLLTASLPLLVIGVAVGFYLGSRKRG